MLTQKLHEIGKSLSKEDMIKILTNNKDNYEELFLAINFRVKDDSIQKVELIEGNYLMFPTVFSKKIGGSGRGIYYLYPNIQLKAKKDGSETLSSLLYSTLTKNIIPKVDLKKWSVLNDIALYLKNYDSDKLGISKYIDRDISLVVTINGKTFYQLMPEVLDVYLENIVEPYTDLDLEKRIDFITGKKEVCGYNPSISFYSLNECPNEQKVDLVRNIPLSKESATNIKKGWLYVQKYLKFNYRGVEYLLLPFILGGNSTDLREVIAELERDMPYRKEGRGFLENVHSRIYRLRDVKNLTLSILYTTINITTGAMVLHGSIEDVSVNKVRTTIRKLIEHKISDGYRRNSPTDKPFWISLLDYFGIVESRIVARSINNAKGAILKERLYLAKLLLGREKILKKDLIGRFNYRAEKKNDGNTNLTTLDNNKRVKAWIVNSSKYTDRESRILNFLEDIGAISC